MAKAIIMPKTGMAMTEGVILQWLMKEGDSVEKGDPVVEIETDKSTMEVEADYDGVLLKILYEAGTTVPVVRPIAFIGDEGEDLSDLIARARDEAGTAEPAEEETKPAETSESSDSPAEAPAVAENGRVKATPAARRLAKEKGVALREVAPSGRHGEVRERDVANTASATKASPLAKRIAAGRGIDLATVAGSGHGGKVMKKDLPSGAPTSSGAPGDTRVKLTQIQKITGRRMLQSHLEIPPVTENIRADVTELLAVRSRLNQTREQKITINDFVLLTVVKALKDNPRLNSVLDGDEVIYRGAIHLGLAVATPKGLLVPVLQDVGELRLTEMAARARDITLRGREGQLKSEELSGSTFTVSNVGMFGINSFTPIINQPEAAIIGVCAVEDQLKMIDGEIVNRQVMGISLTFDHRIVDGAEASIFLKCLKDYLEAPLTVLA